MIFGETYDYLFSQMAGGANDAHTTTRLKDYQRKRLRRALLARSIKPYFLEASWQQSQAINGDMVASTQASLKPLNVLDGAIRSVASVDPLSADTNNFELRLFRTAGDSRVQVSSVFIKDEQLLIPAQAAIRNFPGQGVNTFPGRLGQGAPWPLTWPVPLRLMPNELIQVQSNALPGEVPTFTFCQFRAVAVDNQAAEDDNLTESLRRQINDQEVQRPVFLSMYSTNARSIVFPAQGLLQRANAKTRETADHLLVIGYATLFARGTVGGLGTTCNPKWRLQSSDGHAFSRELIDLNCYGYAGPSFFWQEFPRAFLLKKGDSLSANFSTLSAIASEAERQDNYIIFRCVTV